MATEKNEKLPGYEELHRQVQSGSVGNVYIFQGEETYLMQQAVAELQALLAREDVTFPNIFNFGPVLVDGGEVIAIPDNYEFNLGRVEPRCAIGQAGPLEYVLVVADGRSDTSTGATGAQLAQFMASQGCVTAYNLDGGDTALMWFGGEYYSRQTKRAQSDIIYFATAVDFGLDGTEE